MKQKPRWMQSVIEAACREKYTPPFRRRRSAWKSLTDQRHISSLHEA